MEKLRGLFLSSGKETIFALGAEGSMGSGPGASGVAEKMKEGGLWH